MALINTPKINISSANIATSTRNTAFEVVLMLILIGVGYPYLIKPKLAELSEVKASYNKLEEERKQYEDTKKALSNLASQLEDPNNDAWVSVLDESLPLSSRITRTYLEMQKIVQLSGMTPGNIQVDQSVDQAAVNIHLDKVFAKPRKVAPLRIGLSVVGSMKAFQSFIEQLESQNRVFNIDSLDIQPERKDIFSFRLQMKTYVYVPDAAPTSPSSPSAPGSVPSAIK